MTRPLLPLLLALGACQPDPDLCAGGDPGLTIGTGETSFTASPPGTEVHPTFGPQGGWHVWTALAISGMTLPPTDVFAHLTATVDGVEQADAQPLLDLRCDVASERLQAWGVVFRFIPFDPADVAGKDVAVHASVVLPDGTAFEGDTTWVVVP